MTRLYASTGDGIARLDENNGAWKVALSLRGSRAQCLAVDPRDADVIYAGLREGGVWRTSDGGRTWADCHLPAPGVFAVAVSGVDGAVYAGTEPSALFRSDDGAETWRELISEGDRTEFPARTGSGHARKPGLCFRENLHDP